MEEVSEEERDEYVNEALIEIGSKMKRKHTVKTMGKFSVVERNGEIVLVEYPKLDLYKVADLKELALKLLTTGVVNTINVFKDGVQVDVFENVEFKKAATEGLELSYEKRSLTHEEYRLKKER